MKFSFVNASPNEGLDERERRKAIASFPPLGILYLATVLKERGIEVSVLDQPGKGFTIEETVKWIQKEDPDILGFSTFSTSGRTAALVSDEVKKKKPSTVTVFGNYYATFNSERILRKYPSVDIIVRGEGENTVIDLVNCLKHKGKLKEVSGITFRNNNRIVSTLDRPLIKDLDSLPFPERELIDVEYHSAIVGANVATKKFTSIVSSRGCVYKCRFCSCRKFARNTWRPRSVQNAMLREIAKAGCKVLYFGIESANQRILNYYDKQTTPQQSKTAVKKARKAGIDVIIGSFIVGAPDETREEIQNTIEFAKQNPIDFPQFNILGVYPGTDIWNEFEMKGLLKGGEYWETGIAVSEICPSAVPLHEIRQMIHEAFYQFARRPSFILKQIVRTLKSPYRMNIILNNLSRMGSIRENIRSIA